MDIELQSELNNLVRKSINIKNPNTVTVMCQNQMLIIENCTSISSRLASLIWGTPLAYQKINATKLDTINGFVEELQTKCSMQCTDTYCDGTSINETVGLFAATYRKNATYMSSSDNMPSTSHHNNGGSNRRHNIGVYQYYDFTLLILKNGKIIDYAIHGVRSNINDAIAEHNPTKIYCNIASGDALDIFLNYEYQPFYTTMHGRIHPLKLQPIEMYNFLWFCERRNPFCSFCLALKYLCALIVVNPATLAVNDRNNRMASVIVVPRTVDSFKRKYRNTRNYLNQPHATRRLMLKPAPKKQQRFPDTNNYNFMVRQKKSSSSLASSTTNNRSRKIENSVYYR